MGQSLFIKESFFKTIKDNIQIIHDQGYNTPDEFLSSIIEKLNDEYDFFEIKSYEICNEDETCSQYGQYGAFVDGDNLPYEKVVIFFTPINSKIGDVIIEQSCMPTICRQMQYDLNFLLDNKYKKIAVLTSKINQTNTAPIIYNKLQMDVNSLNTLNIDVIPFFQIKNLSTDIKFSSLDEYLDMSIHLQERIKANSQFQYLTVENNVLYGNCETNHIKGEFIKSFCFRFLTAMFSGKNSYTYSIEAIKKQLTKLGNQFLNLSNFIEYINSHAVFTYDEIIEQVESDIVVMDDDIDETYIDDIFREPIKVIDKTGRKRFKVQKRIKDIVLEEAKYLCNCHDDMHVYFESISRNNYLEGHHLIPMNRQEEYYISKKINLDNKYNLIPLCPNCHSQIHFGSRSARLKILAKLFCINEKGLKKLNQDITIQLLASYYNIGLNEKEAEELLQSISVKL